MMKRLIARRGRYTRTWVSIKLQLGHHSWILLGLPSETINRHKARNHLVKSVIKPAQQDQPASKSTGLHGGGTEDSTNPS